MVAALTISLSACGGDKSNTVSESSNSGGEAAAEEFDGNFVVGFDAEFPPYGYLGDDGEYTGVDLELAQEVAARNGWTFTAQPIDWDLKDQELNSGSISCIWNGFTMTGRESEYTWSVPYIDSSIVVAVRADSEINSLSDLAGKIVMTQADSSGLRALTSEDAEPENLELSKSFTELQQIADYNTAFMNLESGAVDAVVVDIGVCYSQMAAKEGVFKMLDDSIVVEQYAVGFELGNERLRDIVQSTMFEMLDDGTFMEIVSRYSDQGITEEMICLDIQER